MAYTMQAATTHLLVGRGQFALPEVLERVLQLGARDEAVACNTGREASRNLEAPLPSLSYVLKAT
jgi:hypothetical protein